jgi:hypothetical protein
MRIEFIIIATLIDFGLTTHYWRITHVFLSGNSFPNRRSQAQAEDVRQQEMSGAIAEIKRLMAQFGITGDDLGSPVAPAGKGKIAALSRQNIVIRSAAKPGPVAVVVRAGCLIWKARQKS